MKYSLLFLTAFFLSSCSSIKPEPLEVKYEKAWNTYKSIMQHKFLGKTTDYLVVEFGVPTGKAILENGNQVLDYVTYKGEYRCEDRFIADGKSIIIDSRHTGQNGCISSMVK